MKTFSTYCFIPDENRQNLFFICGELNVCQILSFSVSIESVKNVFLIAVCTQGMQRFIDLEVSQGNFLSLKVIWLYHFFLRYIGRDDF